MNPYDDANDYVAVMNRLDAINFDVVLEGKRSRERCGIIDASGEVIEWPNQHEEPRYNFRIPVGWLHQALEDPGVGVWAIWHTHPPFADRKPTPIDLQSLPKGMLGVVIHVSTRSMSLYVNKHVVGTLKYRR